MEDYRERLTAQNVKKTLLLNRPTKGKTEDFLHMEIPRWELEGAIDAGANLIGVISDFGGGKTSLIRSLEEEDKKRYKVCSICLWNYAGKDDVDEEERISNLTHSFLYQLAKETVSAHTATYVNKMLSHNYGMISGDIIFSVWSVIILIVGAIINVLPMFQGYFKEDSSWFWQGISAVAAFLGNNMEKLNYGVLAALVFALGSGGIIFSNKDSQGQRKAGVADAYVVFDYIVTKAVRKRPKLRMLLKPWELWEKKKYLISIEDMDRLDAKEDVLLFMKEIYKYSNMLTEKAKKRFVFIVSASPEMYRNIENENQRKSNGKQLGSENTGTGSADAKAEDDDKNVGVYAKVFDYIIELKPIYQEDRKAVINKLKNQMGQFWKEIMKDVSAEEDKNFVEWIGRGRNLGIRDLKLRLNKALSIYKALSVSESTEKHQEKVRIDMCALTAYLEDRYGGEMYMLIHDDKSLDEFMENIRNISGNTDKTSMLNEIKIAAEKAGNGKYLQNPEFLEDWYAVLQKNPEMLSEYRRYLFRYAAVKPDEVQQGEK